MLLMEMVYSLGRTEMYTKATSKMALCMALEGSIRAMEMSI